ncbi:hypothetical protein OQA88_12265 [Cercophora sp. LCS_1]
MAFRPPTGPRGAQRRTSSGLQTPIATPGPEPAPKPSDSIPPLNNIVPAIFVPFDDAMFERFLEPARDRATRLRRILESIDLHEKGVKENFMYMFQREKERIIAIAKEREAETGFSVSRTEADPRVADAVIRNMEAKAEPGMDYNVKNIPPLDMNRALPLTLTPRELAVEELMTLIQRGVVEMEGYEAHMKGVKQDYLDRLEKEIGAQALDIKIEDGEDIEMEDEMDIRIEEEDFKMEDEVEVDIKVEEEEVIHVKVE